MVMIIISPGCKSSKAYLRGLGGKHRPVAIKLVKEQVKFFGCTALKQRFNCCGILRARGYFGSIK